MFGRAATWMLGLALVAGLPAGAAFAAGLDEVTLRRDDEYSEVVAVEDDDLASDALTGTTGDNTGNTGGDTSGVDSNDGTGSGYTSVSRDQDISRGDKTRDWTRDGAGDQRRRDWSAGQTNDGSRNDTR